MSAGLISKSVIPICLRRSARLGEAEAKISLGWELFMSESVTGSPRQVCFGEQRIDMTDNLVSGFAKGMQAHIAVSFLV